MKKIHLLRHAKSDWGNASLKDIDRPLNARGISAARLMAASVVESGCSFEHVFCSPAVRAQLTIKLISDQLSEMDIQWKTDAALYTFESSELFTWIKSCDESISDLLIVGHNPALTNFCNQLSGNNILNIPTCGYVQLNAESAFKWSEISANTFKVVKLLKPKELMLP